MNKFSHIIGDTVSLDVDIDNLSESASDIFLKLFYRKTTSGLQGEIKELRPIKIVDNKIYFQYNTEDFIKKPITYYGWFHINNNGVILNNFYKIRANY